MIPKRLMAVGTLVIVGAALSVAPFAQARDPIAGPWEQIAATNLTTKTSPPPPNPQVHVIYSNGHYVQFTAAADRPKMQTPTADMTKEQLLERFRMQGQFGTYRVDGNRLTRRIVSAADPNNEGRESISDFRIEGDTLIVLGTNVQGQKTENRYRRLK